MPKPAVLIDGTVFEGAGRIGIWRLFYETLRRTASEIDYTILIDGTVVQPLPDGVDIFRYSRGPKIVSRRHLLWKLSKPLRQPRLRSRFPNHLWHPTFYSLDPRGHDPNSAATKSIVTVYDLLSEDFYWMGGFSLQQELKRRSLRHCDHAISISNATDQRLKRYYPDLAGKTTVMHLAADHNPCLNLDDGKFKAATPAGSAHPYCLFVGGRDQYKHFEIVVRALASSRWPDDLHLHVVGRAFQDSELQFITAQGVGHRIKQLRSVSDTELTQHYRHAECFLFPSLGEGFGLPVLEAQRQGCIPVLSDIDVFREVGGEGALYYPGHCVDALIDCIAKSRDAEFRPNLQALARANEQQYSWDQTATTLLECYQRLFRQMHATDGS